MHSLCICAIFWAASLDVDAFSTDDKKALSQIQKHNKLFLISSIKQGQKLVLSDALAVQSQGVMT